jgi:hypothetical protein
MRLTGNGIFKIPFSSFERDGISQKPNLTHAACRYRKSYKNVITQKAKKIAP